MTEEAIVNLLEGLNVWNTVVDGCPRGFTKIGGEKWDRIIVPPLTL